MNREFLVLRLNVRSFAGWPQRQPRVLDYICGGSWHLCQEYFGLCRKPYRRPI